MKRYYYYVKPLIPRTVQIYWRSRIIARKRISTSLVWPISPGSERKPEKWSHWPDNKKFSLVITHDVESRVGHDRVKTLIEIEKDLGVKSCFNFVPERYNVSPDLRNYVKENGFEVGVHGLKHDGKLFNSRKIFLERAAKINQYINQWNASGFRAPAMHHNLDWIRDLDIEYDSSTFDTDPFEPQPDNVNCIFPFWVPPFRGRPGYVELPYTLPQDFTLFILMREKTIDLWKRKLDWIAENKGMALFNVHPDYVNFGKGKGAKEEFPLKFYTDFIEYIHRNYDKEFWQALPLSVARYYRENVVYGSASENGENQTLMMESKDLQKVKNL